MSPFLPPEILARATDLRWDLHAHPELAHREHRTCERLAAELTALGLSPTIIAGTGIVVDVTGDRDGPMVCVRADIDALPISEASGVAHPSVVAGVMHACGHDVHAAGTWAAAALLVQRAPPAGVVRFLFQPAEETGTGAEACVAEGVLDGVDVILGGHVDLNYPVGTVAVQAGPVCASADAFRIRVRGSGGHGARPHQGVDAVLAAAQMVVSLQQIVAREVCPGTPAVVTIGRITGGRSGNVLASKTELEGTIRAHDPAIRAQLAVAMERVCRGVAEAHGTTVEVDLHHGNDAVVNDVWLSGVVHRALGRTGGLTLVDLCEANMGGEDFSVFQRERPGVYVRWGAGGGKANAGPAHSATFNVDPGVLDVIGHCLATTAVATLLELRDRYEVSTWTIAGGS